MKTSRLWVLQYSISPTESKVVMDSHLDPVYLPLLQLLLIKSVVDSNRVSRNHKPHSHSKM